MINWLEQLLEQQNQGDLTVGGVTVGESDVTPPCDPLVTAPDGTAIPSAPAPKRHYKARARRCKCCHESFTPKRNGSAKYCSDRCRKKDNRAKMAKQKGTPKAERIVDDCTCLWCGGTWLADPSLDPKYCSPSHRTAAYRQRRYSAIQAYATIRNKPLEQAGAAIRKSGMRKVSRFLRQQGYVYDDATHVWGRVQLHGEQFAQEVQ